MAGVLPGYGQDDGDVDVVASGGCLPASHPGAPRHGCRGQQGHVRLLSYAGAASTCLHVYLIGNSCTGQSVQDDVPPGQADQPQWGQLGSCSWQPTSTAIRMFNSRHQLPIRY